MLSSQSRCLYGRNQLTEVICQLRFPEIPGIAQALDEEFHAMIRSEFPQLSQRREAPAPKISGAPGHMTLENQPTTVNYQFASGDGVWRVNLTSRFISLSCSRYTRWEEFAARLDKPLAAFIRIYQPAYFERIGLRYLNFLSRKELGLEGVPFRELLVPCYLGPLALENVSETGVNRCNVDTELTLRGGCQARIHAGPGMVKRGSQQDPELKFVFDQDLFIPGQLPANLSAGALQTLHAQAFSLFRGALLPRLHEALEPETL